MQLQLGIGFSAYRPLVPIEAAMFIADRDEDYLLSAVECGAIPWAWDLRAERAERRELRLDRTAFARWLEWPDEQRQTPANDPRTETEVLAALFPRPEGDLRATELRRMFTCGHQHVLNLLESGLLRAAQDSVCRCGSRGSPRIRRSSILELLKTRRIL